MLLPSTGLGGTPDSVYAIGSAGQALPAIATSLLQSRDEGFTLDQDKRSCERVSAWKESNE